MRKRNCAIGLLVGYGISAIICSYADVIETPLHAIKVITSFIGLAATWSLMSGLFGYILVKELANNFKDFHGIVGWVGYVVILAVIVIMPIGAGHVNQFCLIKVLEIWHATISESSRSVLMFASIVSQYFPVLIGFYLFRKEFLTELGL